MKKGMVDALYWLLISIGIAAVIWLIGQIVYQLEEKWKQKDHEGDYK